MKKDKIKVLFVCMGNICRSPTAEGLFRDIIQKSGFIDRFIIDSAGTHSYHINKPPDARTTKAALERGIDISMLRARQVELSDFDEFDHILVMDQANFEKLIEFFPKHTSDKIKFLLDYAPHLNTKSVPDPYYGGSRGFERVLDMIEDASVGFLEELKRLGL